MPGDLPAWLWLLAFLVLQFSYSCFPPPRPPRPPTFAPPASTTSTPATLAETTTEPGGATTATPPSPEGATTATPPSPDAATSPDGATPPNTATTTSNAETTPDGATTPNTATTPPVPTTPSSETGTCNTTVFSESSMLPHWPASNVLIESQDAQDDNKRFNYWLGNENGQFVLDLGCPSSLDKIDLINTKNAWAKDRATKRFRLLSSLTSSGPFELILEDYLPDSRQQDVVAKISFTFQATTLQYVQFIIVDIWGRGGGLQYLGLHTASQGATTTTSTTEGSNNTSGMTTTSSLTWESGSTSVDIEDDETYKCDIVFDFAFDQGVKVKNAKASCSEGTSSPNALQFAGKHSFEITSTSGITLECSLKVVLVKTSLPSDVLDDTLACSPKDDDCFTTSGQIFPAPCIFPFIHNKRRYKACTDVGSQDPEKLWCPTEVESTGEAVPGQEGFCGSSCGYCAGTDVTSRADEPRPCGYDCLVSARWYLWPILSPVITLEAPKDNYIKESAGQHSLNMGDQVVKLSCPDTHFYADAFKEDQVVFAKCGPTQYRFTVSSSDGKILDGASPNRNFGCDPCPTGYGLVVGYFNFGDFKSSGVFFNIASTSICSRLCTESSSCQSFLFRKSTGWCELIGNKVEKATVSTQYKDYIICTVQKAKGLSESCMMPHKYTKGLTPQCPEGFEFYDTYPKLQNDKSGQVISITKHFGIETEKQEQTKDQIKQNCAEKCIDDIVCDLFQVTPDYCTTFAIKEISPAKFYGDSTSFRKGFCENSCQYSTLVREECVKECINTNLEPSQWLLTSCKSTCSDGPCLANNSGRKQQNGTRNMPTRISSSYRVYVSTSTFHHWKLAWNTGLLIPQYSFFHVKKWNGKKQIRSRFYNDDNMIGNPNPRFYHLKGTGPHPGTVGMNSPNCFSQWDRGHLLSSSMIRLFVNSENWNSPHHENYDNKDLFNKRMQGYMSNIFPQEKYCNQHGAWPELERDIEYAAKACMWYGYQFAVSHTVIPSAQNMVGTKINVPKGIWVAYCCYSTTAAVRLGKVRLVKVTNPLSGQMCKLEHDSDSIGMAASKAKYDSETGGTGGILFNTDICPTNFIPSLVPP